MSILFQPSRLSSEKASGFSHRLSLKKNSTSSAHSSTRAACSRYITKPGEVPDHWFRQNMNARLKKPPKTVSHCMYVASGPLSDSPPKGALTGVCKIAKDKDTRLYNAFGCISSKRPFTSPRSASSGQAPFPSPNSERGDVDLRQAPDRVG